MADNKKLSSKILFAVWRSRHYAYLYENRGCCTKPRSGLKVSSTFSKVAGSRGRALVGTRGEAPCRAPQSAKLLALQRAPQGVNSAFTRKRGRPAIEGVPC